MPKVYLSQIVKEFPSFPIRADIRHDTDGYSIVFFFALGRTRTIKTAPCVLVKDIQLSV